MRIHVCPLCRKRLDDFLWSGQTNGEALRLLTLYQRRLRSNLTHALRGRTDNPKQGADLLAALIDGLYIRVALTAPDEDPEDTALALLTQLTGATA